VRAKVGGTSALSGEPICPDSGRNNRAEDRSWALGGPEDEVQEAKTVWKIRTGMTLRVQARNRDILGICPSCEGARL